MNESPAVIGRANALAALDQVGEYRTLKMSVRVYATNVMDTLVEEGMDTIENRVKALAAFYAYLEANI